MTIDNCTHARIEGNEGMYVLVDMDARHFVVKLMCLDIQAVVDIDMMMTCIEANADMCAHFQVIFDKA